MAEAVVSAVVEFSLEKLFSVAYKNIVLAKDVNSELKNLQNTKIFIQALLLDADKLQSQSHTLQLLAERYSLAVDEVDNFLDARFSRKKLQQIQKFGNIFSASSNPIVCRFRDAKKAEALKKKLASIARDQEFANMLSLLPVIMNQTSVESFLNLETGSCVIKEEVVGRDEDRDNIIRMLFDSTSSSSSSTTTTTATATTNLVVVPIVGIGGIGKTTLAQYVYNDERVSLYFDVCFWVWATQDFSSKDVLQKLLCATHDFSSDVLEKMLFTSGKLSLDQLQCCVREKILGKRYLLVLDNVWANPRLDSGWGELLNVLMLGARGSRILITTRSESVARTMGTTRDPYILKDLSSDASWSLFQRVAFESWQEPGVVEIGKEIVKKCPNVPLVIRTVGRLLRPKRVVKEWRSFRDYELANSTLYEGTIFPILKLSFNELDPHLKLCFAYLSLFHKGYVFDKRALIHCWIASGYVKSKCKKQSLLDAGEDCVLNLLGRGLLISDKAEFSSNVFFSSNDSLRMHDLFHDLAISVAGSMFKLVGSKEDEIDERLRHVSFHEEEDICLDSLVKIRNLQSFRAKYMKSPCFKLTIRLAKLFPNLRVLSLEGLGIEEVPKSIGELIQLRYLDLSKNSFCQLPKSIKCLVNLLSLNLSWCVRLEELPKEIGELSSLLSLDLSDCESIENLPREMSMLVKLRYLRLWGCWGLSRMPIGFGNLMDLQELDWFVVGEAGVSDASGELCELKTLDNLEGSLLITFKGLQCESHVANLHKKEKLLDLRLELGSIKEKCEELLEGLQPHTNLIRLIMHGYHGRRFPSWMMKNKIHCCLTNLEVLAITTADKCTHLCSLGRLPHLKSIRLYSLSSVEYIEEKEEGSTTDGQANLKVAPLFPALEVLNLEGMPKLKGWRQKSTSINTNHSTIRPASFPRLKSLYVREVGIEVVPDEFRGLSFLQTLNIIGCEQFKEIPGWIDEFPSLKTLDIEGCPKLKQLPNQIGNLPNLENIKIERCSNAFAEWWEDHKHPDCPIKLFDSQTQWDWQFKSRDHFSCYKIRKV